MSARQQVAFAAAAVAQSAIAQCLDAHDVEELVAQARQVIDDADDVLRRAVVQFSVQFEVVRHSPAELTRQGQILRDAVIAASRVRYAWQERADVG